jgi:uncharacterized protein YjbI with pentapeptide repeats
LIGFVTGNFAALKNKKRRVNMKIKSGADLSGAHLRGADLIGVKKNADNLE